MRENPQLEAVSTLVGTVIGAGVLGMPYLIAKAGLLNGIILIILLGIAITILYLYYGEIILRTKKIHQIIGYAEKYLGKTGKMIATFSLVIGVYGAVTAYILGSGAILSSLLGGNNTIYSLFFLLIGSMLVYMGIKSVEKLEPLLMFSTLLMILLICFLSAGKIRHANLSGFNFDTFLLPYGLIFFSLLGTNALPEMREELEKNEKLFRRSIIIGMLIPITIYIIFTVVVVGVVGISGFELIEGNNKIATLALIPFVGEHIALFGNLFAILAMSSSFLLVSLSLKDAFVFDFGLGNNLAFILTFVPPAILAFSNIISFTQILDILGVVIGGVTGLLIVLMFWKAKTEGDRTPEYSLSGGRLAGSAILLVLIIGAVYKLLVG
jgi:tyrosine-specific transport protein